MWIFKCALHYHTGDFTRLLMSAISNPAVCNLLKVQVTVQMPLDNVNVR